MTITQITSTVIAANNVLEGHVANANIVTRHLADGSVTAAKLADDTNVSLIYSNIDIIQFNLTSLEIDDQFFQNTKTFVDVIVNNNFSLGDTYVVWADNAAGTVGINTNTPNANLHVSGTILANASTTLPVAPGSHIVIAAFPHESQVVSRASETEWQNLRVRANTFTLELGNSAGILNNVYIGELGNVYIGHEAPFVSQHMLSVNGKGRFVDTLVVLGNATAGIHVLNRSDSDARYLANTWNNSNISLGTSNVFFIGSTINPTNNNFIKIYLDGVKQPESEWIYNSGNNTVQFVDANIVAGLTVEIDAWITVSV